MFLLSCQEHSQSSQTFEMQTHTQDILIRIVLNFTSRMSPKLVSEREQFFPFNTEHSPDHKGGSRFWCLLSHNHRICKHRRLKGRLPLVGKSSPHTAHSSFLHQGKVMRYDSQVIRIGCITQHSRLYSFEGIL